MKEENNLERLEMADRRSYIKLCDSLYDLMNFDDVFRIVLWDNDTKSYYAESIENVTPEKLKSIKWMPVDKRHDLNKEVSE